MVTGRRTQTRERKRIGNRTKGPRNKERVRSVQRDQRDLLGGGREGSSKGLENRGREESVRKQDRGREKGKKGEPA